MKHFRSLATNWYAIIVLASIFLLESCSKEVVIAEIYSGQEIYKGVFFASGPVGSKVSAFSADLNSYDLNDKDLTAIQEFQDEIMDKISSNHPDFWDSFKRDMESGNVARVKSSVELGAKYLSESFNIDVKDVASRIDTKTLNEIKTEFKKGKKTSLKDRFNSLDVKYQNILRSMCKDNTSASPVSSMSVEEVPIDDGGDGSSRSYNKNVDVNVNVQTVYWFYLYVGAAIAVLVVLILLLGVAEDEQTADANGNIDSLLKEDIYATIALTLKVADKP